jgi:hypothetical protein
LKKAQFTPPLLVHRSFQQRYSEIINKSYHQNNANLCIHIESTTLADGTYELVLELEPESEQREAQINLTEAIEDLNPSSRKPKASTAQEGKHRSITPIFKLMQLLLIYGIVYSVCRSGLKP